MRQVCPWDRSLLCAKFEVIAGVSGNSLRVNVIGNKVLLYAPDVELQVFDGQNWAEYAPVLATYNRNGAVLTLREGEALDFFADITPAVEASEKRQFRISVADATGENYYSLPFFLGASSTLIRNSVD